jgi:hypothetical protein
MIDINKIRVASPCSVPWESMTGDEQVRKCDDCGLNVHNLAAMSEAEIGRLIVNREGRLCIRLYKRRDGTILAQVCPTGVRGYRKRMARLATAVFSTVLGLVTVSFAQDKKNDSPNPHSVNIERKKSDSKASILNGIVMDVNGAVIPSIRVSLTLESENKGVFLTNYDGAFEFKDLSPSEKYTLDVGSKDLHFKQASIRNLKVGEGEHLIIRISLEAKEIVIGLFAEEALIDIESSTIETRITRRKLESIPHK